MLKLKTYNSLESKPSLIKAALIFTVSGETFHQDAFNFHNMKKKILALLDAFKDAAWNSSEKETC